MSFQSFSNGKNVLGEDIKHLVKQKSVFLLVQNFGKVSFLKKNFLTY